MNGKFRSLLLLFLVFTLLVNFLPPSIIQVAEANTHDFIMGQNAILGTDSKTQAGVVRAFNYTLAQESVITEIRIYVDVAAGSMSAR